MPRRSVSTSTVSAKQVYGISLGDSFARLSQAQITQDLQQIKRTGFTYVRFTVSWYVVQPKNAKTYNWELYDRIVNGMRKSGLNGLVIIDYTPAWARSASCKNSAYCSPANPQQFASFASAVAKRYASLGVHHYEIWNEENIKSFWQPTPSASGYAAILRASYRALKKTDPKSTVILGGMSGVSVAGPGYLEPRSYLQALYESGVKGYFDILGYHAYTFPEEPNDIDGGKNAWSKMASVMPSIRSIMRDNGDSSKKIWITEIGAPTNGPGTAVGAGLKRSASSDHVVPALQADIASQALNDSVKLPWLGAMFWYTYKDQGIKTDSTENFYGILYNSGQPKPALQIFKDFFKKHAN